MLCFMDSNIAASLFMLLSKKLWAHHSSISAVCRHPLKSLSELEENTEMITDCAQGKD